jgi:xylulokinase
MYFLGIEIRETGTKAIALDLESAEIRAEADVPHSWIEGLPEGYREQDPRQWIDAVDKAIRHCLAAIDGQRQRVAAIGVAGPSRGLVFLDDANCIVRPTKMAGDLSVKRQAEEISREFGGTPGLIEMTGQALGVDSVAAECLWLKQHEPYHYQRISSLLTVQDFIAYWLTGERATEAGSASATGLFDLRTRSWSSDLAAFVDPDLMFRLPVVNGPHSLRGVIRPALAKDWGLPEQVQVGAGSASPMLTALAAGCVSSGNMAIEMGEMTTIFGVGSEPVIDFRNEIVPYCSATGGWLGTAALANFAAVPEALCRYHGWSMEQFESLVGSVPAGADGLLFLPYLMGEKTPRLPEGNGVLHGIHPGNFTPGHLARASLEGVALGLGYALSRFKTLGFAPHEIRLFGAGAQSPVTRQLVADVFGLPVVSLLSEQGPAVGAAMQAAVGFFHESGEALSFEEIASYLVKIDPNSRCEPDFENHALYLEMIDRQQDLVDTLHPAGLL